MGVARLTGTGSGKVGNLIFSGFGLFFALVGLLFVKQEWSALQEARAMQQWAQTPCAIVSSEIADDGENFRLDLSYRYKVGGRVFTSTRYGKRPHYTAETIGEIDQAHKRLASGKSFDCHYNPVAPAESVLDLPTMKHAVLAFVGTLLFPGFGLLFASLPWLRGRRKESGVDTSKSRKPPLSGRTGLLLLGGVFLLIGLLALKPLLVDPLRKTASAKSWVSVSATVVSSKVKSHKSDDSTTYSPYIAYRYKFGGKEYLGDQYSFLSGSSSGYAGKAAIISQYPKGSSFSLYVNPQKPSESVIQREASKSLLVALFPLVFIVVGLSIGVAAFRSINDRPDPRQAMERVVVLKGASPIRKAVGVLFFTLFWNAIVYFLATSGAPLLFPVVFGIFGIIMLATTVHAILSIFNPRATVEITPGDIRPGTSVAMRWRMDGRADRIGSLSIALRCQKLTTETHRRGGKTETRTVKTTLHEAMLLESGSQIEIVQGTLQFQIPEEGASTKPGNDGGIRWHLVFHGDIARWPDLKQELPFIVYPQ